MAKTLLQEIAPYKRLYRDDRTGIAWVQDGTTGLGHTCHPNIDSTGSVASMRNLGYWRQDDRTVRSHGYIYNIDSLITTDELDEIARQHCRCAGKH